MEKLEYIPINIWVTALLDKLGIKYEESGEETITIKYWVERK